MPKPHDTWCHATHVQSAQGAGVQHLGGRGALCLPTNARGRPPLDAAVCPSLPSAFADAELPMLNPTLEREPLITHRPISESNSGPWIGMRSGSLRTVAKSSNPEIGVGAGGRHVGMVGGCGRGYQPGLSQGAARGQRPWQGRPFGCPAPIHPFNPHRCPARPRGRSVRCHAAPAAPSSTPCCSWGEGKQ